MDKENVNVNVDNANANPNVQDTSTHYIDVIKHLKETTVNKDDYDKLLDENRKLIDSLANGQVIEQQEAKPSRTVDELRHDLFNKDMNNLEYVQTALDLRKQLMDSGQGDPFIPNSSKYVPDENDIRTADNVAKVLQECVDYADGNSQVFTNELMRRTVDVPIPKRR